jgi:phage terminase large subunit-like protein
MGESLESICRTAIPGFDPWANPGDATFSLRHAELACAFIEEMCTFTQGARAREPFLLERWQKGYVGNLFGWVLPDSMRRFRESLLFVPRKNGKSELLAAIIDKILCCEDEPGAQLYSAAAKRDQTKFVFDPARKMIEQNSQLRSMTKIFRNAMVVEDRSYRAICSEATTEHGGSTSFAGIDELHAQHTRELYDVLKTSTLARRQPLIVSATTSDYDREGSICNEVHDYASKVRDGIIDEPSFLPAIWEATNDDDWQSPDLWRKVNPNLDVSLSTDALQSLCKKAIEEPAFENTFKRLHLNLRTEQAFRWMPMERWDACDQEPIDESRYDGLPCYVGLDLSSTGDMTSMALCFRMEDEFHVLMRYWSPGETAERRERKERQPYVTWARQRHVELIPGFSIDDRFIRRQIMKDSDRFLIQEIAYDPWNCSTLARQLCEEDGFEVVEFRQGTVSMNEPMKFVMQLVLEKRLRHRQNPVLRWNASNLAAKADPSENIRPDKGASGDKIDGMVAAIMAIARARLGEGVSIYEEREMVLL